VSKRRGNIYVYIAILAGGEWRMKVDETAALSEALKAYQQDNADNHAEARLAIALTRVVEKQVRPKLQQKLRPQDVDDVCSEIILGFWKFRHSVRPDEVGQLIHTLAQRKHADQLRGYYSDAQRRANELSTSECEFLESLPAKGSDPSAEASQMAWDLLQSLNVIAQDRLVAYTLYLGAEKQVIAEVLGIHVNTVTKSLKRCRQAMLKRGLHKKKREADA